MATPTATPTTSVTPRRPRRALRFVLIACAVLVSIVALLVLSLATAPGRNMLAGIIERAAQGSGVSVAITRLSGWPPFHFGADKIVVGDKDGPFAEVDNLDVSLRFAPLLTGTVVLDSIAAERVAVARQPQLPPDDDDKNRAISLRIDKLALARVELGEALIGRAAVLSVNGSYAGTANGGLSANIDANRIDGAAGTVHAIVSRANADAQFALDASVEEAADGLLVGLLGRDSGPAYSIKAKTEPKDRGIEGTVSLASTGAAQFAGTFTLAPAGAAQRLVAKGDGDLGELMPPAYADLLTGPIHVAIDADWNAVQGSSLPRVVIREGTVRTASVRAEAAGTLDDNASNLTLKVDVQKPGGGAIRIPGLPPPSQIGRVSLTGSAAPVNGVMRAELSGRVNGLVLADTTVPRADLSLTLTSAGADPLAGGQLPFALRIDVDSIATPQGRIAASEGAPLSLVADGTFNTAKAAAVVHAKLAAAGAQVAFDGDVAAAAARGTLVAHAADLRTFAQLAGRPLAGTLDATAKGTLFSAKGTELAVDINGSGLNAGDPTLARLLAGDTKLKFALARNSAGALTISDLALNGTRLQATGKATLAGSKIDATLAGSLNDLSVLAKDTAGALQFKVQAAGAMATPTLDATLKVDRGRLLGKPIEGFSAQLQGKPVANGWTGQLSLAGRYSGKRITGGADAALDPASNKLALPRVEVMVGENRLSGALQRTAQGILTGTLELAAPDITTLAALALVEVDGAANARVLLSGAGKNQQVAVKFTAKNIKVQTVTAGTAKGEVNIDDAFGKPRIRGEVDVAALNIGEQRLDRAHVTASVAGDTTRFNVSAKGPDVELTGASTLASDKGANIVTISALNGAAYKVPVKLLEPVVIRLAGDQVALNGVRLALGGGQLRIDGAVSPTLDLTIVADKVSVALANAFVKDLGAEGTLSGRATITGPTDAPKVAWKIDGNGLRAAAARKAGLPPVTLAASGNATLAETSLDARLSGGGAAFTASGQIPYSGSGLSVRAEGTAPLSLLGLGAGRELRLAGSMRANVSVTGALNAPKINGAVDLVDATIADSDTGFGITGGKGRITFDGERATLEQVTGRLLQGGQVSLGGTVDVMGKGMPAKLTASIENGRYADGKVINTRFNAKLAVDGPLLADGTVSGTINPGRTEIQLPDNFGGGATAIDVKHVNAKPGFKDPLPNPSEADDAAAPSGPPLKLAIEVKSTGDIFVRGFGIDAEFGGSLRVGGTVKSPQAIGGFEMRRGRIETLGKRFTLTEGKLTFAGDLIPLLDFQATTSAGDITVTLGVVGPATDPQIKISSNPDLPQEEALSRLLFERSVGSLSPLQAIQLIDAVARFTGVNRGAGIFDRIRRATGVDDLDIRQNAAGDTSVGVSKRINDRVKLGVEAGSGTAASRVSIDFELTKDLKARGEAGQDGSGKIGLTYEHEY